MQLMEGMRRLTDEKRIITGISVAYGNGGAAEFCHYGRLAECMLTEHGMQPAERPVSADSLFDLASVTKLFTAISVLQLAERGKLRLTDTVGQFDKRFSGISDVRIGDLLAFQTAIATEQRVDVQPDAQHALQTLFTMHVVPRPERRFYTDMGAMVLKYVIEGASGCDYYTYLRENVLLPLDMQSTFASVPAQWLPNTACYNYERRILPDGSYYLDTDCPTGVVHDPKARRISRDGADLCGHAGLFSTAQDMAKLAQGLIRGEILSRSSLVEMGKNRTGHRLPDGAYTHYLGYLCYAKHPLQTYSEVPSCFADGTIAVNGFAGTHLSLDPSQDRFMVLLSNRIHNRVTVVTGRPDPTTVIESVQWNDGNPYVASQNYVYYRDEHLKDPIGAILAARF